MPHGDGLRSALRRRIILILVIVIIVIIVITIIIIVMVRLVSASLRCRDVSLIIYISVGPHDADDDVKAVLRRWMAEDMRVIDTAHHHHDAQTCLHQLIMMDADCCFVMSEAYAMDRDTLQVHHDELLRAMKKVMDTGMTTMASRQPHHDEPPLINRKPHQHLLSL